jgi:hypothetical protein
LASCAWQNGDGALANVALDRALADSPQYSMAQPLREALDSGAPPSMARLPLTPEEVAAAYDAAEAAKDAEQARRTDISRSAFMPRFGPLNSRHQDEWIDRWLHEAAGGRLSIWRSLLVIAT